MINSLWTLYIIHLSHYFDDRLLIADSNLENGIYVYFINNIIKIYNFRKIIKNKYNIRKIIKL